MNICVTSHLRDKGFKVTPQRLAIYDILAKSEEHPNAEMIYDKVRYNYPTISLATVYKNLEILKSIGLIQILNVGEDSFRYDADTSIHPHVRCLTCGTVENLHQVDSKSFIEEVIEKCDYLLHGQHFYFLGICPDCNES
jgi:Fur family peroxide stress response transcriptional regulator